MLFCLTEKSKENLLKWINNVILAAGAAHYTACTVRIVQIENRPVETAVLILAGLTSIVLGYVLIHRRGMQRYPEMWDRVPIALFGAFTILIPLVIILTGGF